MDTSNVPNGQRLLSIAKTLRVPDDVSLTLGTAEFAARAVAVLKRELASSSPAEFAAAFNVTRVRQGDLTIFDLAARSEQRGRSEAMLSKLTKGFPRLSNKAQLVAFERAASIAFGEQARNIGYAAGELRLEGHFEGERFEQVLGVVLVVATDAGAGAP